MSVAAKSERDEFLGGNRGNLCVKESKNLDDTVHLQSEKREEWIRQITIDRLNPFGYKCSMFCYSGPLLQNYIICRYETICSFQK